MAKTIEHGFNFLWSVSCTAENAVGVIAVNLLIGKVVEVKRYTGW